ncbi:er lumen protein retaining receptor [Scheffersomyces coipomensis]|uniref:er lumen protein retaining receptor n=1 Tax=Scheffersomyces coipomensis TaxID=1788519 RepID=UPI00315C6586
MTNKYKKNIKEDIDTFPIRYLVGGSILLGLIFTRKYGILEILWTFSLWLEAVAILPQLYILQRTGEAENITSHYIFALGLYRALYIPNWIYRYFAEEHFDYISVLAGLVQTAIYSDFFYIYYTKVMKGKKFELPV